MSRWGVQIRDIPNDLKKRIIVSVVKDFKTIKDGCRYYEISDACFRSWRRRYTEAIDKNL